MRKIRWPHLAQGQLSTLNLSTSSTSVLQWLWRMAHHGWGKEAPSITRKWWLLRDAKAFCFPWPGLHSIQHSTHEWMRHILFNGKMWPYQMAEVNLRGMKTNPRHHESSLWFFWSRVYGSELKFFPDVFPPQVSRNLLGKDFQGFSFPFSPPLVS